MTIIDIKIKTNAQSFVWDRHLWQLERSRIFDYFSKHLSTFYIIFQRFDVKWSAWKVLYAIFPTFWWWNERSRLSIQRDIGREKIMIFGSDSWNDSTRHLPSAVVDNSADKRNTNKNSVPIGIGVENLLYFPVKYSLTSFKNKTNSSLNFWFLMMFFFSLTFVSLNHWFKLLLSLGTGSFLCSAKKIFSYCAQWTML